MISRIDGRVAAAGAAVILAIVEPPVQIVSALDADSDSYWWVVGAVAILAGFAVGGWWAGRRRPATPFLHGGTAALVAFAAHLAIRTIVKLATGDGAGLNAASTLLVGQIAVSLGILGAWISTRRARSTA